MTSHMDLRPPHSSDTVFNVQTNSASTVSQRDYEWELSGMEVSADFQNNVLQHLADLARRSYLSPSLRSSISDLFDTKNTRLDTMISQLPAEKDFSVVLGERLVAHISSLNDEDLDSLNAVSLLNKISSWLNRELAKPTLSYSKLCTLYSAFAITLQRKRASSALKWVYPIPSLLKSVLRMDLTHPLLSSTFNWMLFELQRTTLKALPRQVVIDLVSLNTKAFYVACDKNHPAIVVLLNVVCYWSKLVNSRHKDILKVSQAILNLLQKAYSSSQDVSIGKDALGCSLTPFSYWACRALSSCFYSRSPTLFPTAFRKSALSLLLTVLKQHESMLDEADETNEDDPFLACIWALRAIDSLSSLHEGPRAIGDLRSDFNSVVVPMVDLILSCAVPRTFHPLHRRLNNAALNAIHALSMDWHILNHFLWLGLDEMLVAFQYWSTLFPSFYDKCVSQQIDALLDRLPYHPPPTFDLSLLSSPSMTLKHIRLRFRTLPQRTIATLLALIIPNWSWTAEAASCALSSMLDRQRHKDPNHNTTLTPVDFSKPLLGSYQSSTVEDAVYLLCRIGVQPCVALLMAEDFATDSFFTLRDGPTHIVSHRLRNYHTSLHDCDPEDDEQFIQALSNFIRPSFIRWWFPLSPAGDIPLSSFFFECYDSLANGVLTGKSSAFDKYTEAYQLFSYRALDGMTHTVHLFRLDLLLGINSKDDFISMDDTVIMDAIGEKLGMMSLAKCLFHGSDVFSAKLGYQLEFYRDPSYQDFGTKLIRYCYTELQNAIHHTYRYYSHDPMVTIIPIDESNPSLDATDCILLPTPKCNPTAYLSDLWLRAVVASRQNNEDDAIVLQINDAPAVIGPMSHLIERSDSPKACFWTKLPETPPAELEPSRIVEHVHEVDSALVNSPTLTRTSFLKLLDPQKDIVLQVALRSHWKTLLANAPKIIIILPRRAPPSCSQLVS